MLEVEKTMKGYITIEGAIIIPLFLIMLAGFIIFAVKYYQDVIEASRETLEEDRYCITGEGSTEGEDISYQNPKTLVTIVDGIDDLTDKLVVTSNVKEKYSKTLEEIKKKIGNTGFTIP